MDSISMKDNIHEVESATTHLFLTERTVLGSPGESTDDGLLDFKKVVDSLGGVNEKVRSSSFGSEGPDLTGFGDIPAEVISELTSLGLGLSSGLDVTIIDSITEIGSNGISLDEETIVLVGRLGKTGLGGLFGTSFTERHNGIGNLNLSSHEIVLKILETDLKMELSRGSDDVFTGFFGVTQNHRIGLSKTLHTLNKLGKIGRVLRLNGATNDGRHRELHGLNSVGIILGTDGTRLKEVLIDTNKGTSVTSRDISDLLGVTTHHNNGTLNILNPKFGLLTGNVVGSHDTNLLTGGDLSGEDTAECIETSLVRGGDHLRDVHTKRSAIAGVTSTDGSGGLIIKRTIIKGINTVGLGLSGGRQVKHNHLQNSVSSRKPLLHDTLEKSLALEFLLFGLELNTNGLKHLVNLSGLFGHDSFEKSGDGSSNELTESTFESSSLITGDPLLTVRIEKPVTPKFSHHLFFGNAELSTVSLGETLEGESPLVETRTEGNGSLGGVNLTITKSFVVVHGNNHVDGFNSTAESLVKLFSRKLKFEKSTVNLVNHENGADTLRNGLTKDGLGLDTDTINGIDNNKSTIGNTKGSSDLRGEINVTGGIDKIDEVRVLGNLDVGGVFLLISNSLVLSILFLGGKTSNFSGLNIVLEKHRNTGRLNGNTTLGFVLTGISVTGTTGGLRGNNTSLLDEGIRKGSLSVVDVSNHRHRTDVVLEVHDGPHLIDGEVNHFDLLFSPELSV
mmetsp:Transcript_7953/g.12157  ORF Transcript_7953/g.12157 Transcript_7953/m.12157 type:complete len:732 (+) Transcript_7953:607-2802(+)